MKKNGEEQGIVVTRKEALSLFGLRKGSLISLERAAKVHDFPDRVGYTDAEFKRLRAKLKRILGR